MIGHRVGDQVAGHELADRLEVPERRVADAQPERLVGAVAHARSRRTRRAGSRRRRRLGRAGSRIRRGMRAMIGPSGISCRHWSMILMLSRISSTRSM